MDTRSKKELENKIDELDNKILKENENINFYTKREENVSQVAVYNILMAGALFFIGCITIPWIAVGAVAYLCGTVIPAGILTLNCYSQCEKSESKIKEYKFEKELVEYQLNLVESNKLNSIPTPETTKTVQYDLTKNKKEVKTQAKKQK